MGAFVLTLKDYVYVAVIVLLLSGGAWYTYHERSVGAQKIEASDNKLAAAKRLHNLDAEALAAATAKASENQRVQTVASPPVAPPIVRLCNVAPPRRRVPTTPTRGSTVTDSAPLRSDDPGDHQEGPDIGQDLVTVGRNDDALIVALQARIALLEKEMRSAK